MASCWSIRVGSHQHLYPKKHIDAKPNEMSGIDIKLNSCVNIVGEAFHGKNASLVDPTMKCRSHEGFKILLNNSSSDTQGFI